MTVPSAPGPERSATHLVLIPSYNPGAKVFETVQGAREQWNPVWVVVDGSTDGTAEALQTMARADPGLRVLIRSKNGGKGSAVLDGAVEALRAGYTHVLTMDSDGQHPPDRIRDFMATSAAKPASMVLGVPVFDASAPSVRVKGRRISNYWANVETFDAGIQDSLFGFRVYPAEPLVRIMQSHFWMRRFDFDVEIVVRLSWSGVEAINLPAKVRYFRPEEGGVSHFNYLRDNVLLTSMHLRLFTAFIIRLPFLMVRRATQPPQ
jgi:glycosyltransferase involved in cell wall biosynthesis